MARLTGRALPVNDNSDSDELPGLSTIFAKRAPNSISLSPKKKTATPGTPAANSEAKKPRRRILGTAIDNSLLRPFGTESPAPEKEGRRKNKVTIFDEDDGLPDVRASARKPRVTLRQKMKGVSYEESEDEDGLLLALSESGENIKPRTVRNTPRESKKSGDPFVDDYTEQSLRISQPVREPRAAARRKAHAPIMDESVEEDSIRATTTKKASESQRLVEEHADANEASIISNHTAGLLDVFDKLQIGKRLESDEDDLGQLRREMQVVVPTLPKELKQAYMSIQIEDFDDEVIARPKPSSRIRKKTPPREPSASSASENDMVDGKAEEDEAESEEEVDVLEASCLELDDSNAMEEEEEEGDTINMSDDEEEEEESGSDLSDFVASDGDASVASPGEADDSEDDLPVKPAARSGRRLVQGRRKPSPLPASKKVSQPALQDFQWSDDDLRKEDGLDPVSRQLFVEGGRMMNGPSLPTLDDSGTPRSKERQVEPSRRLKSPTKPKPKMPHIVPPNRQSLDAFWEPAVINDWHDEYSPQKELFQSPAKSSRSVSKIHLGGKEVIDVDLLKSPTKVDIAHAAKAERDAKKEFEATKNDIAISFLAELDSKVTDGEIGHLSDSTGGVKIIWSKTLNTTAGRAHWRRTGTVSRPTPSNPNPKPNYDHHCSIELASKVINDKHRLINVLAHEFCHLTTFMISKQLTNPHGAEFKFWGRKMEKAFGHMDVEITTKHSYQIDWKYIWQCVGCLKEIGRHSKSVDTKRMRCGACRQEFVQIKPVPRAGSKAEVEAQKVRKPSLLFPGARTPSLGSGSVNSSSLSLDLGAKEGEKQAKTKPLTDYQIFVKENMRKVRADNPGSPMKEVMGLVGARYREMKAGTTKRPQLTQPSTKELGLRLKDMMIFANPERRAETELDNMTKKIHVLDLTSP